MAIPGAIKWDKAISVSTAHWLPIKVLGKASRFESTEDASKFIGSEAHDSKELCTTMRGRLLRGAMAGCFLLLLSLHSFNMILSLHLAVL